MAKELVKAGTAEVAAVAPDAPTAPVEPVGVWHSAQRGDVWVDASGKEHAIVGVVSEGFDSVCAGKAESFRLWSVAKNEEGKDVRVDVAPDKVSAVNAWKRKGA